MYLMPLNYILKNDRNGEFYVIIIKKLLKRDKGQLQEKKKATVSTVQLEKSTLGKSRGITSEEKAAENTVEKQISG